MKAAWYRSSSCAAAVAVAAGCGDPMVGTDYRGEPMFAVDGRIASVKALPDELQDEQFLISVFWARDATTGGAPPELRQQPSVSARVGFPATFELVVFEPPQDTHFTSDELVYALGIVLVYADLDGDGILEISNGDRIVGGNLDSALLYASSDLTAADSPTGDALSTGFSLVELPVPCQDGAMMPGPPEGGRGGGGGSGPPPRDRCSEQQPCHQPGTACDVERGICKTDEPMLLTVDPDHQYLRPLCGAAQSSGG